MNYYVSVEELIMRENGDASYELSLSDSKEEASANDESLDDQRQEQRIMLLLPAMQCQQLLQ